MFKTLLLCFVHGFKGDEETFYEFPQDLKAQIAAQKPDLDVHTVIYPKYETRGDLAACVETFREWLQDQVTELETAAATPQAILNPSVGVILVAHSMGGFLAADALFSALDSRPVSADPKTKLMFPLIQGVMSFDTPYNGLSRSMFAYGAFSQYQNLSSIWNIGTSVGSLLASGGASAVATAGTQAAQSSARSVAEKNQSWKRWQLLASRTGTYGAIIAGGVVAYSHRAEIAQALSSVNRENLSSSWAKMNKENITQGLSAVPAYVSRESVGEGFAWMAGHLKFVGALMKQAQLNTRLERLAQLDGIGIVNFYTTLGENGYWSGGYFVPKRTFCAIPTDKEEDSLQLFREQPNPKAGDEISAHCSMFQPEKHPGYAAMLEAARDLALEWSQVDPRRVRDVYIPSAAQRERTLSEAKLWDDDGKMLKAEKRENPNQEPAEQPQEKKAKPAEIAEEPLAEQAAEQAEQTLNPSGVVEVDEDEEENALQLEAIISAPDMPEPEDGGVDEADLVRQAAEVPLPAEIVEGADGAVQTRTWRTRVADLRPGWPALPKAPSMSMSMSMPGLPNMPSMPNMPSGYIPSLPSLRFPGRKQEGEGKEKTGEKEKTDEEEKTDDKEKTAEKEETIDDKDKTDEEGKTTEKQEKIEVNKPDGHEDEKTEPASK